VTVIRESQFFVLNFEIIQKMFIFVCLHDNFYTKIRLVWCLLTITRRSYSKL